MRVDLRAKAAVSFLMEEAASFCALERTQKDEEQALLNAQRQVGGNEQNAKHITLYHPEFVSTSLTAKLREFLDQKGDALKTTQRVAMVL